MSVSLGRANVTRRRRLLLATTVLIGWLLCIGGLFWWYQFRHIGAMSDYWASFVGESFRTTKIAPVRGAALVLHIIDPECPCSRFSVDHIAQLEAKYAERVEFIHLNGTLADNTRSELLERIVIPASPAVAIWDKSGDLAYFGPYSGGSFCGDGSDFVATVIASLEEGFNPEWVNQEAVGCFCPWSTSSEEG